MQNKYTEVIWILVDSVRPDKLYSCNPGNVKDKVTYLDTLLSEGTLFTNVISAGSHTSLSLFSTFTSLYPRNHKMTAYNPHLLNKFDANAITITDILKKNGYKTFRYDDTSYYENMEDMRQHVPSSGFDIWEYGNAKNLSETPNNSFSNKWRDSFILKYNLETSPKFCYIHLMTCHDINSLWNVNWTSQKYVENLELVGLDLKDVMSKIHITESTLLIISSDHGVRLDVSIDDLYTDEQEGGFKLRDLSMKTFCAFFGTNLPSKKIDKMVRTIDIVPTIINLCQLSDKIYGFGISLLPIIKEDYLESIPNYAFMEGAGLSQRPSIRDRTDVWGIRTENWKCFKHEYKGHYLYDLKNDPDEKNNLSGKGLEIESILMNELDNYILNNKSPLEVYHDNSKNDNKGCIFTKDKIIPEISLLIYVDDFTNKFELEKTIDSLLNQICVYYEILVINYSDNFSNLYFLEKINDYRLKIISEKEFAQKMILGQYVSIIDVGILYHSEFLYRLKSTFDNEENKNIEIVYSKVTNKNLLSNKDRINNICFLLNTQKISKSITAAEYKSQIFNIVNCSKNVKIYEESLAKKGIKDPISLKLKNIIKKFKHSKSGIKWLIYIKYLYIHLYNEVHKIIKKKY